MPPGDGEVAVPTSEDRNGSDAGEDGCGSGPGSDGLVDADAGVIPGDAARRATAAARAASRASFVNCSRADVMVDADARPSVMILAREVAASAASFADRTKADTFRECGATREASAAVSAIVVAAVTSPVTGPKHDIICFVASFTWAFEVPRVVPATTLTPTAASALAFVSAVTVA